MDANMRASDADRQHVLDALQRHTADGRLSLDEFATRADAAHHALTYADLAPITADLPAEPVRRRLPRTPVAVALVVGVVLAVLLVVGVAQVASLVHVDTMMATMGLGMGGSCR